MPKWAMAIDLDKCTGCGDCIAACKLENNVAIVDPEQADEGRVMLWMDMMTIYEGEYPNIKVKRIPKPCFHCDNPPCIKVCPVHATYINEEGFITGALDAVIVWLHVLIPQKYLTGTSLNGQMNLKHV